MNKIVIILILLALAGPVVAAEPWAKTAPLQVIQEFGTVSIPNGESPVSKEITFPAVAKSGDSRVVLRFQVRLHGDRPGGWNHFLGMNLNGKLLDTFTDNGTPRVVNRLPEITLDEGRPYTWPWWNSVGGLPKSLLVFFGPGGTVLDERIKSDRDELYWFMVDITDRVNFLELARDDMYASAEPNKLVLTNNLLYQFVKDAQVDLVLDGLTVGYLTAADWKSKVGTSGVVVERISNPTATLQGDGFSLLIGDGGAVQLVRDGEVYAIDSSFSHPGDIIGYNLLSQDPGKSTETSWKPSVRIADEQKAVLTARGDSYELERTVSVESDRLRVLDKITNLRREPVGVRMEHSIANPNPFRNCLLGGVPETMASSRTENPTLFIQGEGGSLGVFAADNVSRLQLAMVAQPNRALLKVEHFGLDAGDTYTFEWVVYPFGQTADYWTFINRLRKDIGIDYTIDGPWGFFDVQKNARLIDDPNALRAYLKRKNLKIVAFAPWIDYENMDRRTGKLVTREQYKAMMQKAAKAFRAVDPSIRLTGSVESFPYSMSLEDSQIILDRLPDKNAGYPLVKPSILDGLAGVDARRKASLMMNPDGKHAMELYYREGGGQVHPMTALIAYAAPGNAMQELLLDQSRFIIEECGLDGIYIDSYNMACDGYMAHLRFSYDKWDGHTVDIDPSTGRVTRRYTDVELLGAPARAELIDYVLKAGDFFVANGYSPTADAQKLRAYRFSESEYNFDPLAIGKGQEPPLFYRMCASHLSSPVGLGYRPERLKEGAENYAKVIMKNVITYLRHGALFYHYSTEIPEEGPGSGEYGPINHMFPITPVELGAGFVTGRERIITAVSRTFEWKNPRKPQVLVFDINGRETTGKVEMSRSNDGWTVVLDIEDWENVAVIE